MLKLVSHGLLQSLYESARTLLDGGGSPEILRHAVEALEETAQFRDSPDGQEILNRAAKEYTLKDDYDVDVDNETIMYHNGVDGYWVMAWCFVEDDHSDDDETDENADPGNAVEPSIVL